MYELAEIFVTSIVSLTVLFIITKIMGYRQISQLSFFDYVIGISIGSIAAEMATNLEMDMWKPLLAMVIYGVCSIIISKISMKSIKARRFLSGAPVVVMYKGQIIRENLKKVHYDVNDLLTDARVSGYFDISDIDFAVMEDTGKISFLPKAEKMPPTVSDLGVNVSAGSIAANVIIDGEIMHGHLKNIGKDEVWLKKQLKMLHASPDEIFLATVDGNDKLRIFKATPGNDSYNVLM